MSVRSSDGSILNKDKWHKFGGRCVAVEYMMHYILTILRQ